MSHNHQWFFVRWVIIQGTPFQLQRCAICGEERLV